MIKNTTIINLEDLVEKDLNPDKNLNQDKNHHLLIDKEEKINIRKSSGITRQLIQIKVT